MSAKGGIQYFCAVLLIVSSIALAFIQVFDIRTIAHGTLIYIAQAFLLAGSIFGLEWYVRHIHNIINANTKQKRTPSRTAQQQST